MNESKGIPSHLRITSKKIARMDWSWQSSASGEAMPIPVLTFGSTLDEC
jgi:hypothetical protein